MRTALSFEIASRITKNIPYFRGLGKLCRLYDTLLLNQKINPMATANMKDGTQILVDLRSNTEVGAFYFGHYDTNLINTISSIINPNANFLDIGANIGFYTIAIANIQKKMNGCGRVIAFEPFCNNYQRLLKNIEENNLDEKCLAYNLGLSNESTNKTLVLREDFENGSQTGNASIAIDQVYDRDFTKIHIYLETLDNIYQDLTEEIDIIKIDIEGHEDFCLKGSQETIRIYRPVLLMEVNKPYYKARRVNIDELFFPLFPKEYSIFAYISGTWKRIESFSKLGTIDNVFVVPNERLDLDKYNSVFAF